MQKFSILILFTLILCGVLNACGTKGRLYIPENEYPQDTPAKQ